MQILRNRYSIGSLSTTCCLGRLAVSIKQIRDVVMSPNCQNKEFRAADSKQSMEHLEIYIRSFSLFSRLDESCNELDTRAITWVLCGTEYNLIKLKRAWACFESFRKISTLSVPSDSSKSAYNFWFSLFCFIHPKVAHRCSRLSTVSQREQFDEREEVNEKQCLKIIKSSFDVHFGLIIFFLVVCCCDVSLSLSTYFNFHLHILGVCEALSMIARDYIDAMCARAMHECAINLSQLRVQLWIKNSSSLHETLTCRMSSIWQWKEFKINYQANPSSMVRWGIFRAHESCDESLDAPRDIAICVVCCATLDQGQLTFLWSTRFSATWQALAHNESPMTSI